MWRFWLLLSWCLLFLLSLVILDIGVQILGSKVLLHHIMVGRLVILLVQVFNSLLVLLCLWVLTRLIQPSIRIVQTCWIHHLLGGELCQRLRVFFLLDRGWRLYFTSWFTPNFELLLFLARRLLHLLLRVYWLVTPWNLVLRQLWRLCLDDWAVAPDSLSLLVLRTIALVASEWCVLSGPVNWRLIRWAAAHYLVLAYAVLLLERVWRLSALFHRALWWQGRDQVRRCSLRGHSGPRIWLWPHAGPLTDFLQC